MLIWEYENRMDPLGSSVVIFYFSTDSVKSSHHLLPFRYGGSQLFCVTDSGHIINSINCVLL